MKQLMTKYLIVPLATIAFLLLTEALAYYVGPMARAIAGVFIVFYIYAPGSNLIANLIAWLILSGYCLYFFDPWRAGLVIASFAIVGLYDARKNRLSGEKDRQIQETAEQISELVELSNGVQNIVDKQRSSQAMLLVLLKNMSGNDPNRPIVEGVVHTLAEAETLTRGWYTLDRILKEMKESNGGGNGKS